jgi:hypothetical protein
MRHLLAFLASLMCVGGLARAGAEERYYFALLSCHEKANAERTFALLIKTMDQVKAAESLGLETKIVSCIAPPEANELKSFVRESLGSLRELLENAQASGARTTVHGPYPVRKELYDRILSEANLGPAEVRRDSNPFRGPGIADSFQPSANAYEKRKDPRAANCLLVVRALEPWLLPPRRAPDWLRERLELKKYGVELADNP